METSIGQVTRFSNQNHVAVLSLTHRLELSDTIHFLGKKTDFYQLVLSLVVNSKKVLSTGPGAEVAIRVSEPVHKGDRVLLVPKETSKPDE